MRGPCRTENDKRVCGYIEEYTVQITIDEWMYDLGKRKFIRYLTFEQGKLRRVRTGSYGE